MKFNVTSFLSGCFRAPKTENITRPTAANSNRNEWVEMHSSAGNANLALPHSRAHQSVSQHRLVQQVQSSTAGSSFSGTRAETNSAAIFDVLKLETPETGMGRVAVFGERRTINGKKIDLHAPIDEQARIFEINVMHSFVKCSDGEIRRFPGFVSVNDDNFESQIKNGQIYDSEKRFIVEQTAGYQFDESTGKGAFKVRGKSQTPAYSEKGWEVYQLDNGRTMVPQPSFMACTHACEAMMLLDKKLISPQDLLKKFGYGTGITEGRDPDKYVPSLKRNAGIEPLVANFKLGTKEIKKLQELLRQHGPCMVDPGGHVRILDDIRTEKGKYHFVIRDPFHGTVNVIKQHDKLFYGEKGVDAIFLTLPH